MKKTISTLILGVVVLLFVSSCSKKSDSTTSTAGTTDGQSAFAIYSVFSTVLTQLQYSKTDTPADNINQTIPGPNGGTVVVSGTFSVNQTTGQTTWNLTVTWNNYVVISSNNNYTINGQMTYSGTVSSTSVTAQFSSTNLSIVGTFNGSGVNETLTFNYTVTWNNSHGTISGTIDGRTFSYNF
jgi:hypothetical protein